MLNNIILMTDSYKQTHHLMYPPGTQYVYSYLEARAGGEIPETVFFGLNYLLQEYLVGQRVTLEDIAEAEEFCEQHFGNADVFNRKGWMHIWRNHDGFLPLKINAVQEGKVVPESNVLLTIQNTDPECAWLVNHFETLLVQLWYPCTVATISRQQKKMLKEALEATGTVEKLPFMLHDFGYRGSTSVESAALGGAAHLLNFMGTDTIAGIELLRKYYDTRSVGMPGFSVPAAEHSTITAWGENAEVDAYRHILNTFQSGLVSVVSDSWDIFAACEKLWGGELAYDVRSAEARTVVIRPDSGDPIEVILQCLNILSDKFGSTVNSKGYRVLPDYVRLIQGDGISRHTLPKIVDSLIWAGWSLDNIVFGSGGGLLQDCNRDTLRFAMKCAAVQVNGEWRDVYKRPASDPSKNSKQGKLKLTKNPAGIYTTIGADEKGDNYLTPVFLNGIKYLVDDSLDNIRQRAEV